MKNSVAQRMRNMSQKLNQQRYDKGIGVTLKKGRPVSFTVCPKTLVYLAATLEPHETRPDGLQDIAIDSETPLVIVRNLAMMTPCECHPCLTVDDLLRIEFE